MEIEATVIGHNADTNRSTLGWKSDQIRASSYEMTLVEPSINAKWLDNRLDFSYYQPYTDIDCECEILLPLGTPGIENVLSALEVPQGSQGVTNTTFKNVRLGDKVNVYLKKDGTIAKTRTSKILQATVVGLEANNSIFDVKIAWRENEETSKKAVDDNALSTGAINNKEGGHDGFQYYLSNEENEFAWCDNVNYYYACQIIPPHSSSPTPAVQAEAPKPTNTGWLDGTLTHAKVGDEVLVYLDEDEELSPTKTSLAIMATVIGLDIKEGVTPYASGSGRSMKLGWKRGTMKPMGAVKNGLPNNVNFKQYIDHQDDYVWYDNANTAWEGMLAAPLPASTAAVQEPAKADKQMIGRLPMETVVLDMVIETPVEPIVETKAPEELVEAPKEQDLGAWISVAMGGGAILASALNTLWKSNGTGVRVSEVAGGATEVVEEALNAAEV